LITRQFTDFTGDYAPALEKLKTALQIALNMPAPVQPTPQTVLPTVPAETFSPDPNEDNFFAYLAQMDEGATQAQIARDLYQWAQQHADTVEFGGRFTPGLHVKVNVNGKSLTIFSLLAYMRNPAVQIPFDYLAKYAPFTSLAHREATLKQLNALLPKADQLPQASASKRPSLTLLTAFNSDEALAKFKKLVEAMIAALKAGKA
jgi:hypothetical protein